MRVLHVSHWHHKLFHYTQQTDAAADATDSECSEGEYDDALGGETYSQNNGLRQQVRVHLADRHSVLLLTHNASDTCVHECSARHFV